MNEIKPGPWVMLDDTWNEWPFKTRRCKAEVYGHRCFMPAEHEGVHRFSKTVVHEPQMIRWSVASDPTDWSDVTGFVTFPRCASTYGDYRCTREAGHDGPHTGRSDSVVAFPHTCMWVTLPYAHLYDYEGSG